MLSGLYNAAAAMETSSRYHEVIAQNLAHAQMPGYRRMSLKQASFQSGLEQAQQAGGAESGGGNGNVRVDFSAGPYERTERQFDFAIQGEGFFEIEGPDRMLYTRNGTFHLDEQGRLVTADGLLVRGGNGTITIPAEVALADVSIAKDGTFRAGEEVFGQLTVYRFERPELLEPAGVTLFAAPDEAEKSVSTEALVLQGTRERSNVHPIQELVEMIAAQRRHESAERSMKMITQSIQRHIDL